MTEPGIYFHPKSSENSCWSCANAGTHAARTAVAKKNLNPEPSVCGLGRLEFVRRRFEILARGLGFKHSEVHETWKNFLVHIIGLTTHLRLGCPNIRVMLGFHSGYFWAYIGVLQGILCGVEVLASSDDPPGTNAAEQILPRPWA